MNVATVALLALILAMGVAALAAIGIATHIVNTSLEKICAASSSPSSSVVPHYGSLHVNPDNLGDTFLRAMSAPTRRCPSSSVATSSSCEPPVDTTEAEIDCETV